MSARIPANYSRSVLTLVLIGWLSLNMPSLAQTAGNPGPKAPGTVRIGLMLPQNSLSESGNSLDSGEPIRQAETTLLTGPALQLVKLQAVLPDQAMLEAKQLDCDYVLSANLSQQKAESSGRFGKLMSMRALQAASSSALSLPGNSSAKQIGAVGVQVAQQQISTATQGVKANSEVTLHYTLTAVDGHVTLDESAKTRSKANGENVVTPMLTEAATKIVAVAKPLSIAPSSAPTTATAPVGEKAGISNGASLRTYQNYDFVPGDKPVFVDDFSTTQEGEFPEKWELISGQGTVNQQAGYPSFVINSGDPARMKLRMRESNYLGKQFTLEFDIFGVESQWGPTLYFNEKSPDQSPNLMFRTNRVVYSAPEMDKLEGAYPQDISYQNYLGRWHHVAIAYKQPQMKVYVDQYRVLYLPDTKSAPLAVIFGGEAGPSNPVVFRDVRLATGGGANYVGKQFTDSKIVMRGINFDLNKATLRPESMGALNQIAKLMAADTSLKFEIDGHTDNSGQSAHNQELSAQRAIAVKEQLVSMGIDASRLTTKGLGDSKPLGPNDSAEGRANNRRVEFLRL